MHKNEIFIFSLLICVAKWFRAWIFGQAIQKNLNLPGRPFAVSCLFDSYGPVINSVPVSDTAFAHRGNILCCMQTYLSWDGENQDDNSEVWMTRFGGDLAASGNVSGQAYPNYIDSTRDDWQTAYYGANLDPLKAIKKKYDPDNWFSFPQSIPLAQRVDFLP